MNSSKIGKAAEDMATKYLEEKGYRIVERNFKAKYGEIDIIAKDGETTVFVEVRYRKNSFFGSPEESITKQKINKIIKTASRYISMKNIKNDVRFDVIAIEKDKIRHIKGAFCIE